MCVSVTMHLEKTHKNEGNMQTPNMKAQLRFKPGVKSYPCIPSDCIQTNIIIQHQHLG